MKTKARKYWIYREVELFCRSRLADDPSDRETMILLIFILVLMDKNVKVEREILAALENECENLKTRSNLIYFAKAQKANAERISIQ